MHLSLCASHCWLRSGPASLYNCIFFFKFVNKLLFTTCLWSYFYRFPSDKNKHENSWFLIVYDFNLCCCHLRTNPSINLCVILDLLVLNTKPHQAKPISISYFLFFVFLFSYSSLAAQEVGNLPQRIKTMFQFAFSFLRFFLFLEKRKSLTYLLWILHRTKENSIIFMKVINMVHISPDLNVTNMIAVIAVLFKIGRAQPILSSLRYWIKIKFSHT